MISAVILWFVVVGSLLAAAALFDPRARRWMDPEEKRVMRFFARTGVLR